MTGTIRPHRGHAIGSGHCNSLQLPQRHPLGKWRGAQGAWMPPLRSARHWNLGDVALNIRILARLTVFAGIRLTASHQTAVFYPGFPPLKCVPRPPQDPRQGSFVPGMISVES